MQENWGIENGEWGNGLKSKYRTAEYRMSNVEVKEAEERQLRHSEFGVRYSIFAFNWGQQKEG